MPGDDKSGNRANRTTAKGPLGLRFSSSERKAPAKQGLVKKPESHPGQKAANRQRHSRLWVDRQAIAPKLVVSSACGPIGGSLRRRVWAIEG